MSLLDRTKKVKDLKSRIFHLDNRLHVLGGELRKANEEIIQKDKIIAELEAIKQPATLADMTKIMGLLIDYSKIVARLGGPDPVGVRPEIPEIFNRYNIKWIPVDPYSKPRTGKIQSY